MSLVRPLERFTDILEFLQEEEDLRRQREDWPSVTIEGDQPRRKNAAAAGQSVPRVCRLCGHTATVDYCVECLAFTME